MMKRFFLYGIPKSFLLKLIIALSILLIGKNVFAAEMDITNKIKAFPSYTSGTFMGQTPAYIGAVPVYYNVKTRYNGTLSLIEFYINSNDWDWDYNKTYSITLYMATEDWRNHFMGPQVFRTNSDGSIPSTASNMYVQNSFRFISTRQIKFNFKTTNPMGTYTYFRIYSSNVSTIAFTGDTNFRLERVVINPVSSAPTAPPITPVPSTPTPTPQPNNQDIINNNTENTNNIINNNNQNTQDIIDSSNSNTTDIIDNNNANTQDIIDNQNKNTDKTNSLLGDCHKNLFNVFGYEPYTNARYSKEDRGPDQAIILTSTGNYTGGSFPLIYHLKLKPSTRYHFQFNTTNAVIGSASPYFYVYHSEPSSSANLVYYTGGYNGFVFTTDSHDYEDYYIQLYISGTQTQGTKVILQRPMLFEGTYHSDTYVKYNDEVCVSKLDDTTSAINNLNDTMNNSNVDNGTGSDFFNDFSSQDNGGISGIITKPLVLINSLLSNNNNCNALTFGIKFPNNPNKNVSFPSGCVLWDNVPSNVVNIYHIFIVGFCSYYLLKRLFKDVEDLKNPEKDNVEVIDL